MGINLVLVRKIRDIFVFFSDLSRLMRKGNQRGCDVLQFSGYENLIRIVSKSKIQIIGFGSDLQQVIMAMHFLTCILKILS